MTHIVDYNRFLPEPGDPPQLPYAPTADLNVKLVTTDFHWEVEFAANNSQHFVVCQIRKLIIIIIITYNNYDDIYRAVIMTRSLREFTRFIW